MEVFMVSEDMDLLLGGDLNIEMDFRAHRRLYRFSDRNLYSLDTARHRRYRLLATLLASYSWSTKVAYRGLFPRSPPHVQKAQSLSRTLSLSS